MENEFDLYDIQQQILRKCPEWDDLIKVADFQETQTANPVGYRDKTIYLNPFKLEKLKTSTQEFLIAQQLMHIQLAHQQRGKDKNRRIWNIVCDLVVNELLIDGGFEAPDSLMRFEDAKEMSAEEMYDLLFAELKDNDSELDEADESAEQSKGTTVISPEDETTQKSKSKLSGDAQGAQAREIDEPGVAQAVAGLSKFIEPSMQLDYDWFPADRIRDGILVEQFKAYPVPHAEILLDTSASIDEELLRTFVRAVKDILKDDTVVKVGCFDTEFYGFQELHSEKDISKLEIIGSGGTNFEAAVKAFTGEAETKIIFTDGYAEMPETRIEAIWVVYSDIPVNPPGGKVIYVNKPEELDKDEVDFLIT